MGGLRARPLVLPALALLSLFFVSHAQYIPPSSVGSSSIAWGNITGTLSSQTDLNTALGLKVPTTRSVAGHALSGDVAVACADLSNGASGCSTAVGTSATHAATDFAQIANNLSDVTAATALANLGGVPASRTVAGHALSSNVTVACGDLTNSLSGCSTAAGLLSGSIFTGLNQPNSSSSNWQNYSIIDCFHGYALNQYPSSWKVRMGFTAGSPVIGAMKILRTLARSASVIDSTTVQIGGVSSPTLSSPGIVDTDAISLALDNTHDYYFVIFFTNTGANSTVSVVANGASTPNGMANIVATPNVAIAGDQSGVSTIPSFTGNNANAPYLVLGAVIP